MLDPETVDQQKRLNKIAGIVHEYMERQAYPPNYRRRWRKRFRERAIDSGIKYTKGARGPVIFRYPNRMHGVPLLVSETFEVPRAAFDFAELVQDSNLIGSDPTWFKPMRRAQRTASGAMMMRHQAKSRLDALRFDDRQERLHSKRPQ